MDRHQRARTGWRVRQASTDESCVAAVNGYLDSREREPVGQRRAVAE